MLQPDRRTKIVATIGPVSSDEETLATLVDAGMDGVRLNFSHGTHTDHELSAQRARAVQAAAGRPLALIADLQGPKIRIGELDGPAELEVGESVVVAGQEACGKDDLPVAPDVLASVLEAGDEILIDDGHVRLRVERLDGARAFCEVVTGGMVEPHKGVNVPGVPLPVPSLTEKDLVDLEFALSLGVDYVAQSFVRTHTDVAALKSRIEAAGSQAWVIAKVELKEAVLQLETILDVADAVMIARGDLGVEIGAAEVPLLQKKIIVEALERGKPAITATQMLETMIHRPEPTRAEASDVANAILDGTSAVMLSAETAVGEYPVEAVATMARIARAVEPSLGYRHQLPSALEEPTVGRAMSNAACDLAEALGAKAILVPTFTGRTASAVARLRPRRPVVALTHVAPSRQHMAIEWGVTPLEIPEVTDVE
jgi:pyruvate kinase